MQGFVGQRAFTVNKPTEPAVRAEEISSVTEPRMKDESVRQGSDFLITLISRRSINRPGLRYLRRGLRFPFLFDIEIEL